MTAPVFTSFTHSTAGQSTITGSGLSNLTAVELGGAYLTVTPVSDTTVNVIAPRLEKRITIGHLIGSDGAATPFAVIAS